MDITETRRALRKSIQDHTDLPTGNVDIRLGPSAYAVARSDDNEMCFLIKVGVDPEWADIKYPADEVSEIVDRWLAPSGPESIKAHLEEDEALNSLAAILTVTKTSGHRLYQETPEGPPVLGAEWTVRTLA